MTPALQAKLDNLWDNADTLHNNTDYLVTADRLQLLRSIRDTADSALHNTVALARREGMTWEEIARWIGGTKQNAQQRYGSFGDSTHQ